MIRKLAALLLPLVVACADGPERPAAPDAPAEAVLSVRLEGRGGGRVVSTPAGIDCATSGPSICSASFPDGSQVALTHAPDPGDVFAGWGDACAGAGPCLVTLSGARSVAASFGNPREVATVVGDEGGRVTSVDEGLTLVIPTGATAAGQEITVESVDASALGSAWQAVVGDGNGLDVWEMGPSGLTFDPAVEVALPSEARVLDRGGVLSVRPEFLLTERDGVVESLEDVSLEVDPAAGRSTLTGRLGHFSPVVRDRRGQWEVSLEWPGTLEMKKPRALDVTFTWHGPGAAPRSSPLAIFSGMRNVAVAPEGLLPLAFEVVDGKAFRGQVAVTCGREGPVSFHVVMQLTILDDRRTTTTAGLVAAGRCVTPRTGTVSGTVTVNGRPPDDGITVVAGAGPIEFTATPDEEGRFTIPDLPLVPVRVSTDGSTREVCPEAERILTEEDPTATVELECTRPDGVIEGRVTVGDRPLDGATVALLGPTPGTAVTGDDGRFRFEERDAGWYTFEIEDETLVTCETAPPGVEIDLLLDAHGEVEVRCQEGVIRGLATLDGGPWHPLDLTVYRAGEDEPVASGSTDPDGSFEIPGLGPGSYELGGEFSDVDRFQCSEGLEDPFRVPVALDVSAPEADVSIGCDGLPTSGEISGSVTSGNVGVPGLLVVVSGSENHATFTDGEGTFAFSGLAFGSYAVGTPGRDDLTCDGAAVEVRPREPLSHVELVCTAPETTGTIRGTATSNLDGSPVAGLTIRLALVDITVATATTDGNGGYAFPGRVAGTYLVEPAPSVGTACTPSGPVVALDPLASPTATQDFLCGPAAVIKGTVTVDGQPASGVFVGAADPGDIDQSSLAGGRTDASGAYAFTAPGNGTWNVRPAGAGVCLPDPGSAVVTSPGDVITIDFACGTPDFDGSISGTLTVGGVARPGAGVRGEGPDGSTVTAVTGDDGLFTLPTVVEGEWRIDSDGATGEACPEVAVTVSEAQPNANADLSCEQHAVGGVVTLNRDDFTVGGATVQLLDPADGRAVAAGTVTDGSGHFALDLPDARKEWILRVDASSTPTLEGATCPEDLISVVVDAETPLSLANVRCTRAPWVVRGTVTLDGGAWVGRQVRLLVGPAPGLLLFETTDGGGQYSFSTDAFPRVVIDLETPTDVVCVPPSWDLTFDAAHTEHVADFSCETRPSQGTVSGTARRDGSLAAGILILLTSRSTGEERSATTDGTGFYTVGLPFDTWDVTTDGAQGEHCPSAPVTVSAEQPTATADLTCQDRAVAGTVTLNGSGVPGYTVEVVDVGTGAVVASGTTGPAGGYGLSLPGNDAYALRAVPNTEATLCPEAEEFLVVDGSAVVDVACTRWTVRGTVTKDGAPAPAWTVAAQPTTGGALVAQDDTDAAGTYAFSFTAPDQVVVAPILVLEDDGEDDTCTPASYTFTFTPANAEQVADFACVGPATSGTISGSATVNGDPAEGLTVTVTSVTGGEELSTTTQADGSFSVDAPFDTYDVTGQGSQGESCGTVTVLIEAGAPDAQATLACTRPTGGISGTVTLDFQPHEGETVELVSEEGAVLATATSGADGTYLFPGVSPGFYGIRSTTLHCLPRQGVFAQVVTVDDPVTGRDLGCISWIGTFANGGFDFAAHADAGSLAAGSTLTAAVFDNLVQPTGSTVGVRMGPDGSYVMEGTRLTVTDGSVVFGLAALSGFTDLQVWFTSGSGISNDCTLSITWYDAGGDPVAGVNMADIASADGFPLFLDDQGTGVPATIEVGFDGFRCGDTSQTFTFAGGELFGPVAGPARD